MNDIDLVSGKLYEYTGLKTFLVPKEGPFISLEPNDLLLFVGAEPVLGVSWQEYDLMFLTKYGIVGYTSWSPSQTKQLLKKV